MVLAGLSLLWRGVVRHAINITRDQSSRAEEKTSFWLF